MYGLGARRFDPELKQIVSEASRALALLDADRLEELARACKALNRDHLERAEMARQARDAACGMAAFARVLDATRDNLSVMNRLRALRMGEVSYETSAARPSGWALAETSHGND
jgi:predicted double-glycine peptidase